MIIYSPAIPRECQVVLYFVDWKDEKALYCGHTVSGLVCRINTASYLKNVLLSQLTAMK